jgi:hypothetical protein
MGEDPPSDGADTAMQAASNVVDCIEPDPSTQKPQAEVPKPRRAHPIKGVGSHRAQVPQARDPGPGHEDYPDRTAPAKASQTVASTSKAVAAPLTAGEARNIINGKRNPTKLVEPRQTTPSEFGEASQAPEAAEGPQAESEASSSEPEPSEPESIRSDEDELDDEPLVSVSKNLQSAPKNLPLSVGSVLDLSAFCVKHRARISAAGWTPNIETAMDLYYACSGSFSIMTARVEGPSEHLSVQEYNSAMQKVRSHWFGRFG